MSSEKPADGENMAAMGAPPPYSPGEAGPPPAGTPYPPPAGAPYPPPAGAPYPPPPGFNREYFNHNQATLLNSKV